MNIRHPGQRFAHRQAGVSLVMVLILLVVMSLLGLAVLRSSGMQERMSANMYDRNLAQQAAEMALVAGRDFLDAGGGGKNWQLEEPDDGSCAAGVCHWNKKMTNATVAWQPGPTLGGTNADVPDTTSQFWIEYLGMNQAHVEAGGVIPASGTTSMGPLYRITAQSQGNGRANVVLQSDVIYRLPRL